MTRDGSNSVQRGNESQSSRVDESNLRNRRSVLKSLGAAGSMTVFGLGGAGTAAASPKSGDSIQIQGCGGGSCTEKSCSEREFSTNDHYNVSAGGGGSYEGTLETSVKVRHAADTGKPYWTVPVEIDSNTTAWANPPSGDTYSIDHVDYSEIGVNFDPDSVMKDGEVVYSRSDRPEGKYWIGGYYGANQTHDTYTWADAAIEFGFESFIDVLDTYVDAATLTLFDKATLLAEIYDKWEDHNSTPDSYSRSWAWGSQKQTSTWSKYDAYLYNGEHLDLDIGFYADTTADSLYNSFTISVFAPDSNPGSSSTSSATTYSTEKSTDVKRVRASKVANEPGKYGLAPSSVSHLEPDDVVRFAPARIEVSNVSHKYPGSV